MTEPLSPEIGLRTELGVRNSLFDRCLGLLMQFGILFVLINGITVIPNLMQNYFWDVSSTGLNIAILGASVLIATTRASGYRASFRTAVLYRGFWLVGSYLLFIVLEGILAIGWGVGQARVLTTIINASGLAVAMCAIFLCWGTERDYVSRLRFIVSPYIYLCSYIAVAGVAAWSLLFFGITNHYDWSIAIGFSKDFAGVGGTHLYSMPYYLSLILTGEDSFSLFGATIVRLSGLSKEPTVAAAFVTPSLFLFPVVFPGTKRFRRRVFMGVVIAFLFLTASVLNWVLLACSVLIIALKRNTQRVMPLLAVAGLFLGGLVYFVVMEEVTHNRYDLPPDLLEHKLTSVPREIQTLNLLSVSDNVFGPGLFAQPFLPRPDRGMLSFFVQHFHFAVVLAVGLLQFFAKSRAAPLGLAVVYYGLHAQKSPMHFLEFPFYTFLLVVSLLGLFLDTSSLNRGSPEKERTL